MKPARGFTLIEILVAVSLLAMIGVLGYRGLESIRHTGQRLGMSAERMHAIALTFERLGGDVRQALPVPGRRPDGSEAPAWQTLHPTASTAALELTLTRSSSGSGDLQRLTYRWHEGLLELITWPAHDALQPGRRYPLLGDIDAIEFAYLDRDNRWRADWPASELHRLPRALRLKLHLAEGGQIERIFDVAAAE